MSTNHKVKVTQRVLVSAQEARRRTENAARLMHDPSVNNEMNALHGQVLDIMYSRHNSLGTDGNDFLAVKQRVCERIRCLSQQSHDHKSYQSYAKMIGEIFEVAVYANCHRYYDVLWVEPINEMTTRKTLIENGFFFSPNVNGKPDIGIDGFITVVGGRRIPYQCKFSGPVYDGCDNIPPEDWQGLVSATASLKYYDDKFESSILFTTRREYVNRASLTTNTPLKFRELTDVEFWVMGDYDELFVQIFESVADKLVSLSKGMSYSDAISELWSFGETLAQRLKTGASAEYNKIIQSDNYMSILESSPLASIQSPYRDMSLFRNDQYAVNLPEDIRSYTRAKTFVHNHYHPEQDDEW